MVLIILILIFLFVQYRTTSLLKSEGLYDDPSRLTKEKNDQRKYYAIDNPNIQYTVNPVEKMIDKLGGTKWYPQTYPRRVDSIMDPMTESKLYKIVYD